MREKAASPLPTHVEAAAADESEGEAPAVEAAQPPAAQIQTQQQQQQAPQQPKRNSIPRKPLTEEQMRNWRSSGYSGSPLTPDNDDTPYIQFAIEQLTRDEEVMGHSREAGSPAVSPVSPERSSIRHVGGDETLLHKEIGPAPPAAAMPPRRSRSVSPLSEENGSGDLRHFLVPDHEPRDTYRYPPLKFIPRPLGLIALGAFMLFIIGLIILLIISSIRAGQDAGLWAYDGVGTARYFLFQYLPTLLAVLALVWLHYVQAAIQRILPFAILAGGGTKATDGVFSNIPLYLTNYLFPDLRPLRYGEYLLGFCSIIFWLANLTVPLASAIYQTRLYSSADSSTWNWTTVQPVAFVLIFLYIILIFALVAIHLRFRARPTGLKWDPVALADVFVLLNRSPLLAAAQDPDTPHLPDKRGWSRPTSATMGYWESPSRPGTFLHGIRTGPPDPPPQRMRIEKGRTISTDLEAQRDLPASNTLPAVQASTFESWHSNSSKTRPQPAFLRDSYIILYPIVALVLLAAFLAASYTNAALITGFDPRVPASDTASATAFQSFAPADFLYAFLPALLATLLPLLWTPLDTAFRYLQPFASLASPRGAPATRSLLASYPAQAPLLVCVRALLARHLRVALLSLLTPLAWALPVLAGGLFTAQFVAGANGGAGAVFVRADPGALYALSALLVAHALGWATLWPGKTRRVPGGVDVRYLKGVAAVAGAELGARRGGELWAEPRSRTDLVTRLVGRGGGGRWGMREGKVARI